MLKIEAIEQRGERWLEWRKDKGTASDAAAVMGMSDWFPNTWYELYLVKTGKVKIKESKAMRYGIDNESIAREVYESIYGFQCQPVLVSKTFSNHTLGCSLDGWDESNEDHPRPVEIKCPFLGMDSKLWQSLKNTDEIVDSDELIPQYYWQCQHIMLVTGSDAMHFFVWTPEAVLLRTVLANDFQQKNLQNNWQQFLNYLNDDRSPPLTAKDKVLRDDKEWTELAEEFLAHDELEKSAKKQKEIVRKKLIDLTGNQNSYGAGVRVTITHDAVSYNVPEEVKERYKFKKEKPTITVAPIKRKRNGETD
tara:strand:- start:614 stop:1534 length:921 start_codon:yes stop_codon:yes gene_type:complete